MRTIAVSLCAKPRCAPAESLGGDETGKSTDFGPRHPPSAKARETAAAAVLRLAEGRPLMPGRLVIMEPLQSQPRTYSTPPEISRRAAPPSFSTEGERGEKQLQGELLLFPPLPRGEEGRGGEGRRRDDAETEGKGGIGHFFRATLTNTLDAAGAELLSNRT